MNKKVIFAFFLIQISIFSLHAFEKEFSHPEFESFSHKDTDELRKLFRFLFAENAFGYTLLGDKPMSFCFLPTGQPHISTRDHIFKICLRGDRSFVPGVLAWNKLQIGNHFGNYLLVFFKEKNLPTFAIIINKRSFYRAVNENIEDFKEIYGLDVTAEKILQRVFKAEWLFGELFSQHYLLGILLGYGKQNAALFQRRNELYYPSFQIPFLQKARPGRKFSTVKEEMEFINKCLRPVMHKSPFIYLVRGVNFVGDLSLEETQVLKREYEDLHRELTLIFKQPNWLELLIAEFEKRE